MKTIHTSIHLGISAADCTTTPLDSQKLNNNFHTHIHSYCIHIKHIYYHFFYCHFFGMRAL